MVSLEVYSKFPLASNLVPPLSKCACVEKAASLLWFNLKVPPPPKKKKKEKKDINPIRLTTPISQNPPKMRGGGRVPSPLPTATNLHFQRDHTTPHPPLNQEDAPEFLSSDRIRAGPLEAFRQQQRQAPGQRPPQRQGSGAQQRPHLRCERGEGCGDGSGGVDPHGTPRGEVLQALAEILRAQNMVGAEGQKTDQQKTTVRTRRLKCKKEEARPLHARLSIGFRLLPSLLPKLMGDTSCMCVVSGIPWHSLSVKPPSRRIQGEHGLQSTQQRPSSAIEPLGLRVYRLACSCKATRSMSCCHRPKLSHTAATAAQNAEKADISSGPKE